MIIAVAGGKGGTGKTTVATNLALAVLGAPGELPAERRKLVVADCDLEAPRVALFLNPLLREQKDVGLPMPVVDQALCIPCDRCTAACRFGALAVVDERVRLFPELCCGCGRCTSACPAGAISEALRSIGQIARGRIGSTVFLQGSLSADRPTPTPVVREIKRRIAKDHARATVLLNAPAGISAATAEALRGADYALLVTEPTPFGLQALRRVAELAHGELGLPAGVVLNRDGPGDGQVEDYCRAERLPILLRIPFDRQIAEAHAKAVPLLAALPEYGERFRALYRRIAGEVSR